MCKIIEDFAKETAELVRERVTERVTESVTASVTASVTERVTASVTEREKVKNTISLIRLGKLSFEDIANVMGLPLDRVKELAAAQ